MLNTQANTLFEGFERKYSAAIEAFEIMNLYLDNQKLKLKDIQAEYAACKSAFERDCEEATRPLRRTSKLYDDRTPQGIKQHFTLGARPDRGCDGHLLQVSRLRVPLRG